MRTKNQEVKVAFTIGIIRSAVKITSYNNSFQIQELGSINLKPVDENEYI